MNTRIFFTISLIFILGCSSEPTFERYDNIRKKDIGQNIFDISQKGEYYKMEQKDNTRWYYHKSYNHRTGGECIFVSIVDANNIIIDYKILTRNTCKSGIPNSG